MYVAIPCIKYIHGSKLIFLIKKLNKFYLEVLYLMYFPKTWFVFMLLYYKNVIFFHQILYSCPQFSFTPSVLIYYFMCEKIENTWT